jgi:hypothetical protein
MYQEIKAEQLGEYLLPFGPESFVFWPAKNVEIHTYRTIMLHVLFMGIKLGLLQ